MKEKTPTAKIAILTLTDQRDSAVDTRIAEALTQLGHETIVRSFATAGCDCVCYEKPDVVIVPMVGSQQKLDFVKRCHEWGIAVVVRRGEAGAAREVLARMDRERRRVIIGNYDYASYVDLELTWGPEFSDILAENQRMRKDKIVACGPFTLDACFHRIRPVRPPGRKTLLFATAWSGADDDPRYTECGLPADSPLQTQMYKQHRKGRDAWLHAIRTLYLTKNHRYDLLLKVRPGESTAEYIRIVGQFVRILPYDFPSAEAILMSDCVIHAGSTMAVEAHLLGVPSINFTNCNPDPRLADVTIQCGDVGQLTEALARMNWGRSNIKPEAVTWLQDHLYGWLDGRACQRAADAVDKLLTARNRRKGKNALARPTAPDQWPHVPTYDIAGVSAKPVQGWLRLSCMSCHGVFSADPKATVLFCPYCALTMRKIMQPYARIA